MSRDILNEKKIMNVSYKNHDLIIHELKENDELWNLFTKKEEYHHITHDKHGRFTYNMSSYKTPLKPIISHYLQQKNFTIEYPDNKKFVLLLTHDVDDIYITPRHMSFYFYYFLINKDPGVFLNLYKGIVNKQQTNYKSFNQIISIEQRYDALSTFYFLCSPHDIFGEKYTLDEVKNEIGNIIDKGCEIGYHTGYDIYNNVNEIIKEKNMMEQFIGKKVSGARNHVLRFDTPDSWECLSKAGFKYDSSFGYHDMIGFRNGICHPFQPFNLDTGEPINILEIPLNVQDWALKYEMKKSCAEAWQYIKELIDIAEKYNGVLNLLWHTWTYAFPVSLGGIFSKEWTYLYEKIIKYAYEKKAWITNCHELTEYWYQ